MDGVCISLPFAASDVRGLGHAQVALVELCPHVAAATFVEPWRGWNLAGART